MYGWRGRIGVVLPSDNTVVEKEFARRMPVGVSCHSVRLSTGDQRDRMPGEAVERVSALRDADVDVVGYMCAASSFLLGPGGNVELCSELSERVGGSPSFTATTAMTAGLRQMEVDRVAVLSPHPEEIAERLRAYLEEEGFEVVDLRPLNMGLAEINNQGPDFIYRKARGLAWAKADGIFIAATNFRATEILECLATDTGRRAASSNECALRCALEILGVSSQCLVGNQERRKLDWI